MKPSVITEVVRNDICIGCGICAALCPEGALEMAWNRYGEYSPIEVNPCSKECGLCLKVCPFADHEENEDTIGEDLYGDLPGIGHRPETGYYLATYVGYADKHRSTSASGGVATWLLERLLTEDIVDHVVCVAPTDNPEKLFSFAVFDTPVGVRAGAGSAYYPVEMSQVIRHILENPGRYAVTGLPCFIKAIRLAQQKNIKLKERIIVTVGLVCGQLKSSHFTDYIASLSGLIEKLNGVRYRGKSQDQPAGNYFFAFTTNSGEERRIYFNEGIAEAWLNRWFTPNACNYCDDIFAECADVACMDAWLPEYSRDCRGTSLVLVRSPQVRDLIVQRQDIFLDPISIERLVQSQRGVLAVKRQHLAYRLYLDQEKGQNKVPMKRVAPGIPRNPFLRREVALKDHMSAVSRDTWTAGVKDTKRLRDVMKSDLRRLAAKREIERIITFPVRTLRHIRRKVGGSNHG